MPLTTRTARTLKYELRCQISMTLICLLWRYACGLWVCYFVWLARSFFGLFWCVINLSHWIIQVPQRLFQLPCPCANRRTYCSPSHLLPVWKIPSFHTTYNGLPNSSPLPPSIYIPTEPTVISPVQIHRSTPTPLHLPTWYWILVKPRSMEHQRTRSSLHHGKCSRRKPIRLERHRSFRGLLQCRIWLLVFINLGIGYPIDRIWVGRVVSKIFGLAC